MEVTMGGLPQPLGQGAAKQVQALTLCLSCETVTIVENLGLSDDQRGNVAEIVAAIQRYVEGHINESVERRTSPPPRTAARRNLRQLPRQSWLRPASSARKSAPKRTLGIRS